ncbi:flagellar biosynthesis anti-sigma factor FlgM [Vagococcus sp.]|uniref:flagellar biosynthesis anti-sigma factor FlgM n=1 Tax=Vagococcus sp. TaxID=1933889 RepID=UPI003F9BEC38
MKINNQYRAYLDATKQIEKSNQNKTPKSVQKDQSVMVDISTTGRKLLADEMKHSDEKVERLASIKQAIKTGTYRVDPEKLANQMLKTTKEQREF